MSTLWTWATGPTGGFAADLCRRDGASWMATSAVACGLFAGSAAAAPRVAGDPSVAQRLVDGDAELLILGDSINHIYLPPAYKKFAGFDVGGQLLNNNQSELFALGMDAFVYNSDPVNNPRVESTPIYNAGDVTVDGITGVLPGGGWGTVLNSGVVPTASNPFQSVLVEARFTAPVNASNVYAETQSGGAFWLDDAPDGSFDLTLFSVAGPNGLPAGTATVEVYQGSTLLASAPLPDQVRAPQDAGWDTFTINVPGGIEAGPGTFGDSTPISMRVRLNDGVTVNQGLNFTLAGMYASNGLDDTFGYSSLALSGKRVDWFLDDTVLSDDTLGVHIQSTGTDLTQIWLGENSWGNYDAPTWKALMQDLIDKVRGVDPDMDIALVSQYDTRNNGQPLKERLAEYNQALLELALENDEVVYLNLFEEAGDAATLDALYLADSVHPNAAGVEYFGGVLQELYAAAALIGDYDASGSVEQADLDLVLTNWGLDTDAAGVPAGWVLGLPDGVVDQAELDAVLTNWGSSSAPSVEGSAVPEPGLAVLLGSAFVVGRRRWG